MLNLCERALNPANTQDIQTDTEDRHGDNHYRLRQGGAYPGRSAGEGKPQRGDGRHLLRAAAEPV